AMQCASAPVLHVAAAHGLSWQTVHRAQMQALARWQATRAEPPLEMVGVDEKWLGRRLGRKFGYITIVSNLATGEPVWIGRGRDHTALANWIATLSPEQKARIRLFAMDMHEPFRKALQLDPVLASVPVVHDPFHITKRALEALNDVRKS